MQIRVLGHLEASVDDRAVALGGAKQRAVLAMLGLEANRTVTADHLIEGLWGEHPPASAAKMVQNYVWRLRAALDDDAGAEILTRGRGYELHVDPQGVDVWRFERLLAEASRAAEAGEPTDAAREALALWRGPALADVADEPFAAPEIRRLEELRVEAAELAIGADLAAGRHQEVAAEINALVSEHPLRERLHAQRMLALYRCGRQAEALGAYRAARRTLVEEIGLEPGPELQRLHDAILRQDASLDVEPTVVELPRELDPATSPPVVGRDDELRALRATWRRAATGSGALVTLAGAYGMGKTRLAGEIAAEAHREGALVLYAAGTGPPEGALAAIARTRNARRPTLLVLDDADRAAAKVAVAASEIARGLGALPALVLATGQEAAALARLEPQESLVLEPLDADAVRLIARFYAPAGSNAIPVDTLLATSRGVARRVHEAASEWARQEATRRVDAVAGRAAAGRTEARALEDELTGSVVDLQSTRERAGLIARDRDDSEGPVVCPYRGLASFDTDDAEYFFGREQLVAELVARLVGAPLLCVVGPSGSGKSSVIRAGLLHALGGGVLPGSDGWARAVIRPGEHPMRELRRAAGDLGGQRRLVLAVDQFEELFTACENEQERSEFVAALVRAARDPESGSVVVLAVRADFYGRCAAYPDLSHLLGANHVLVGPMSRDELRRAIERPAQRVGLSVEPELVDSLLMDVEGQPGALPLLSTTLLELWGQRDGRHLRLSTYARSGGVQGAVARLAEDAFVQLDPSQQAMARKLLLRLAGEGEGGAIVRRRIELTELETGSVDLAEVVARLTGRRLLTASEGALEVAHEALLREWPRLRAWLEEDVEGRRLQRQVADAARAWDADARDPEGLYRGARLTAALEWRSGHEDELNATERAFLDACRAAGERAHRRLQMILAGVGALLVVAVIAGVLALDQRANARSQARVADAQRLGAQALTVEGLDRSLLLAREALALDDSAATRDTLLAALLRSPSAVSVMRGTGGRMLSVAIDPHGRTIAAGDNRGRLLMYDALGRQPKPVRPPYRTGLPIHGVRFSPDGTRLVVVSGNEAGAALDILDERTFRRIVHHRLPALVDAWGDVAFSPDSRQVVTAYQPSEMGPPGNPGVLRRFDARTGRTLGRPARLPGAAAFLVALPSDGRMVTISDATRETVIRDADTLRPIRRFAAFGLPWASAVSSDGRLAALGRQDGSVRLLDLHTGRSQTLPGRHGASVESAAFTPDGRTLVTAGDDAKVIVRQVAGSDVVETFSGHAGRIAGLAVASDGRTVYSASLDGTVIAWDLAGSRRLGRPFGGTSGSGLGARFESLQANLNPGDIGYNFGSTPDGDTLAVARPGGFVNLIDTRSLRSAGRIRATDGAEVVGVDFAPDDRTLAITAQDGSVRFWDARARAPLSPPLHAINQGWSWSPTFSADGRWLATAGSNGVRLWDARRHVQVRARRFDLLARDVALRPDGKVLAVPLTNGPGDGSVEILSVPSLKRVARIPMKWGRWSRFSADGRQLVLGSHDGQVRIYDGHTFAPRGRPLLGHTGFILTADFSPDGRTLATSSNDGTIRLWDTASSRPIGQPLTGLIPNIEVGTAFIRGGSHLAAVYAGGQGYVWDVRPSSWARHACAVAGRPLTRSEWEEALPGHKYEPACRVTDR
jgi:WD40 repeat protein/DNA-binding SARP family transcriptional activator